MNKYFYPIYRMKLKPWIKYWLIKKLNGSGESTLKVVTISSGTLKKVDKSKALSIKEYYGNTVQNGTPTPSNPIEVKTVSGDNNVVVSNKNLFVATDVFNGYITGTGALVSNANNRTVILRAKPNTTYTIQAERKGIVRSDDFILSTDSNYPSVGSTTAIRVFTTTDTEIVRTFTTRATDNWIAFKVGNISNSSFEETLTTIQLEEGNQATSYIAHQGNSYRVDLGGKNLLNNTLLTTETTKNGITATPNADGSITLNGTASDNAFFNLCRIDFGTTSFNSVSGGSSQYVASTSNPLTTARITYDASNRYTFIVVSSGNTVNDFTIYPMIEEGNQATEYSPYTDNPIELCKIGEYQDKLYYDSGKWYIEKNIGKVVFNGDSSENWYYNSENKGFSIAPTFFADRKGTAYIGYCNYFSVNKNSTTWTAVNYCGWNISGTFWFRDNGAMATSKADLLTYLSTHNLIVYYVLATPITEEITDSNLILQLNALYGFYVQSNTVSISNNSEIPLEVLLEYYGR